MSPTHSGAATRRWLSVALVATIAASVIQLVMLAWVSTDVNVFPAIAALLAAALLPLPYGGVLLLARNSLAAIGGGLGLLGGLVVAAWPLSVIAFTIAYPVGHPFSFDDCRMDYTGHLETQLLPPRLYCVPGADSAFSAHALTPVAFTSALSLIAVIAVIGLVGGCVLTALGARRALR